MRDLSKKLVETNDIATKRDAYYQSKGAWGPARFEEQEESDAIMDDIEAMSGFNRERIGFIPDEDGSAVAGELIIIIPIHKQKKDRIDCARMGTGGHPFLLLLNSLNLRQMQNSFLQSKKHQVCFLV